jgi:ADP-heptose:LPS heptosyltransferase
VWVLEYYLKLLGLPSHYSQTLPIDADPNSPFKGKVVLHPSSGSPKKNPPIELFLEIENFLTVLGYQCVYLVGEADQWLKAYVKNFVEMSQPLQIAKALKSALFFVGNDSGLSHLSAYLGLPTFIFYGPTDPVVWKPIGNSIFQISLNLSCSPCFPNTCQEMVCFDVKALFERFLNYFRGMSL